MAVLLRTIFSVVSFLLTWILFCQYAFGKMEEASRRARELKAFVRDLRYFIGHHNSNPSIANQPETKAMAAQYELRFYDHERQDRDGEVLAGVGKHIEKVEDCCRHREGYRSDGMFHSVMQIVLSAADVLQYGYTTG